MIDDKGMGVSRGGGGYDLPLPSGERAPQYSPHLKEAILCL